MNRYYLNAEQTGQRDVAPRPFDNRPQDDAWLEHEHLPWEGESSPPPYRGRVASDFPAEDLYDDMPPDPRRHHPGGYAPSDWPGQALRAFFYGFAGDYGRHARAQPGREVDHRGRGPKGYRRSDERITEEICERLSDDPTIDASDISVRCEAGEVVLEGSVGERAVKHRVEDLVDDCAGVTEIRNRLTVSRMGKQTDVGLGPLARNAPPMDAERW